MVIITLPKYTVDWDHYAFDQDGTIRQANALDKLDDQPYAISSYQFEGARVVLVEVSVSGFPTCGKKTGIYEIRMPEGGNIGSVYGDAHPQAS